MPRRRLKLKLDKLRVGISFALAIVSYNISNWIFEQSHDVSIWKWLKSQGIISHSVLTLLLTWIFLLIVPIAIWYKIMGFYFNKKDRV